jgi:hypothetical protein
VLGKLRLVERTRRPTRDCLRVDHSRTVGTDHATDSPDFAMERQAMQTVPWQAKTRSGGLQLSSSACSSTPPPEDGRIGSSFSDLAARQLAGIQRTRPSGRYGVVKRGGALGRETSQRIRFEGTTLADLDAAGLTLDEQQRGKALAATRATYGVDCRATDARAAWEDDANPDARERPPGRRPRRSPEKNQEAGSGCDPADAREERPCCVCFACVHEATVGARRRCDSRTFPWSSQPGDYEQPFV